MNFEILSRNDISVLEEKVDTILQILQEKSDKVKMEWIRTAEVKKMLKVSDATLKNYRDTEVLKFTKVAIGFIIAIAQAAATNNKKKDMESRLTALPDFSPTQQVMGCDGNSGLAVDEPRKKICLITNSAGGVSERIISYKDIFSAELFEDGTSITKTVRSSQVGGAVVGGLLLGGVGAIIGGLSGKTETSGKIKRIDLRLIVNDTKLPLHDVAFMNVEGKKDGIIYPQAIQQARLWHGIVEVLIKRADAEVKISQIEERLPPPALPAPSVADELKKLAELHSSGVLTSEEFQQQKVRLLSAHQTIA